MMFVKGRLTLSLQASAVLFYLFLILALILFHCPEQFLWMIKIVIQGIDVGYLLLVQNYRRHYVIRKAFLEQNDAANPSVTVLEWVNLLEYRVKIHYICITLLFAIVAVDQARHIVTDILRRCCYR